jgi:hypothetical protein
MVWKYWNRSVCKECLALAPAVLANHYSSLDASRLIESYVAVRKPQITVRLFSGLADKGGGHALCLHVAGNR